MTVLPTTDQLALLYTAAKAYGKASVHTSEVFRAAGCKQSDDVKQASRARDGLYREMDAIRDGLNERFPGLALACPAPYVGFTADVAGYEEYVARRLVGLRERIVDRAEQGGNHGHPRDRSHHAGNGELRH